MNKSSYVPPIRKETDSLLQRDLRELFLKVQELQRMMQGMQAGQRQITTDISGLSFTTNSDGATVLTLANKDALRAALFVDDIAGAKSNRYATANPTATDDSGKGYSIGSIWINVSTDTVFMCADANVGAAVWKQLS